MRRVPEERIKTLRADFSVSDELMPHARWRDEMARKAMSRQMAEELVSKLFEYGKVTVRSKSGSTLYHVELDVIVPPRKVETRRCVLCRRELRKHEYQMCDECDFQTG